MARFVVRRLLWGVVLLALFRHSRSCCSGCFRPVNRLAFGRGRLATPKVIEQIRINLGLNHSLLTQFVDYMKGIFLHFDLGYSYYSSAPVKELIADRLPATISLTLGATVIWVLQAWPSG